jgi:hypothetical protein
MAVNRQCPNGARGQGMSLMSDHGCQPTSLALMQACHTLGIHQAFTSDNQSEGSRRDGAHEAHAERSVPLAHGMEQPL